MSVSVPEGVVTDFVGNTNIPADELRGVMQTQAGGFFSFLTSTGTYREEAFRNDIDLLHAAYYDRGYLNVEIDNPRVALSSDRRYLDVTIFVREGARYRVGRLHVREIDESDQEIEPLGGRRRVREMLHANPGDWFSRSVIGRDILAVDLSRLDDDEADLLQGYLELRKVCHGSVSVGWDTRGWRAGAAHCLNVPGKAWFQASDGDAKSWSWQLQSQGRDGSRDRQIATLNTSGSMAPLSRRS